MATAPSRYVNLDTARARFGERVDRLAPFFDQGDPLADAAVAALAGLTRAERDALLDRALREGIHTIDNAPRALVELFAQLDRVPFWVDRARCDRGGEAFLRAGVLGGFVLGFESLILGYCSPAGNKPLSFSGRLDADVPRRLAETSRFVQAVSLPGGMQRHSDGFAAAVKVRLMHAQVRRMLVASPRWNRGAWGVPINQVDSAATVLLFSLVVIDGLSKLGAPMGTAESEDLLHLWRYIGWVMGVTDELLATSLSEAWVLSDLIQSTQDPPDRDSITLAHALLRSGEQSAETPRDRARAQRFTRFAYALSRHLLGDALADGLELPRTPWRFAMPAIRTFVRRSNTLARAVPGGAQRALERGTRYWETVVTEGIKGRPVTFSMPETLRYR